MPRRAGYSSVLARLEREGLLLLQDRVLPSVATLVAGEVVRGSWWGHPAGQAIFAVCERFDDSDAVVSCKLVNRKVTFVHARLWPALLGAVASPRQTWQTRGLSDAARRLRRRVRSLGSARVDELGQGVGPAARELEERLLVLAVSEHTESGQHVKRLTDWGAWGAERGVEPCSAAEGRRLLEGAIGGRAVRWPWAR